MMPDSTQHGDKTKVRNNSKKKKFNSSKQRKTAASEKSQEDSSRCYLAAAAPCSSQSASSASSVSRAKKKKNRTGLMSPPPVKPLSDYVDEPQQLIDQLFQIVKGEELRSMLPLILQNISARELKSLCLSQLEQLDKEEVLKILSENETEEATKYPVPDSTSTDNMDDRASVSFDDKVSTIPSVSCRKCAIGDNLKDGSCLSAESETTKPVDDALDVELELFPAAVDEDMLMDENIDGATAKAHHHPECRGESEMVMVAGSVVPEDRKPPAAVGTTSSIDLASNLTKMQMEILELELRARAIKALLRAQGDTSEAMDVGEVSAKNPGTNDKG